MWHDGVLNATWFQGVFEASVKVSQEGYARGSRSLHFLAGSSIDVAATRAVAQTKITITSRGPVEGVLCDVVCTGRFYDLLEKRSERWGLVVRQPIYERDHIDAVDPAQTTPLDRKLLMSFPEGYRHLAYFADARGLQGQARHARPRRTGTRRALRPRRKVA